jgi:hypothetical protein
MISRRFFGIASTICQSCDVLIFRPSPTSTVRVQAGERSKKSSGSEEARYNRESQTSYCSGAVVALQAPPLQ